MSLLFFCNALQFLNKNKEVNTKEKNESVSLSFVLLSQNVLVRVVGIPGILQVSSQESESIGTEPLCVLSGCQLMCHKLTLITAKCVLLQQD